MKPFIQNSLLAIASLVFVILCVVVADRIVGRLYPASEFDSGLIFAPYDRARYNTMEFDVHVQMNNLGFRGEDVTVEKRHKIRVVVLGDSYVFGWGVDLEATWIKQLEAILRSEGYDVEILNLGGPGRCPGDYANTAERALPLLKPDIVLVGVLQGNDLEQLDRWKQQQEADRAKPPKEIGTPAKVLNALVGNLSREATQVIDSVRHSRGPERDIRELWKVQTQDYLAGMSESSRADFDKLSAFLRRAFLDGTLNPGALTWLFPQKGGAKPAKTEQPGGDGTTPDDASTASPAPAPAPYRLPPGLNINSRLTRQRIDAFAEQLGRIRATAEKTGSRVIVLSIPENNYIQTSGWVRLFAEDAPEQARREVEAKLVSTVPDDAVKAACDRLGVPMLNVTASFRNAAKGRHFYFEFDGHFTPEGNAFLAQNLAPLLGQYLH